MYWAEPIDGGHRYWWVPTQEVKQWLETVGIHFETTPNRFWHDVHDKQTAMLIKLTWGGTHQ